MNFFKKINLKVLLVVPIFFGVDNSKADPEPSKIAAQQSFAGIYWGRNHQGNGVIKVRCFGNQGICYTITTIGSGSDCDLWFEFGNGEVLRAVADCNIEPTFVPDYHPVNGQEVLGHTYTTNPVPGWSIWDPTTETWNPLPIQNIWVE